MKVLLKIDNTTGEIQAYSTIKAVLRSFNNPPDYQKIRYRIEKYGKVDILNFTIKLVYYANK